MIYKIPKYHFFYRIFSAGVSQDLDDEFNDRLIILNIFTLTCVLFCTPYYMFLFVKGNFVLGSLFLLVQISFSLSLLLNKFRYYTLSKILILISTNYSILFLNFAFGYESGFCMYYFTSPLIVFSFFNFSQRGQTIIGLLLYLSSYLIAEISHSMGMGPWIEISAEMLNFLYITNVFFAFSFLIVLARSFSKFHYFTSQKVIFKNQELEHNKNELETLLNEKNTLLSETHHRVKNNLAVISGLFDLQLMFEKDPKLKSIFTNSKNRIKSMSLIHESLYRQTNVSQIDFKIYTELLISEIKNSMEIDKNVQIKIDMESIYFNLSKAIPCGLIINEVVTNCFKHAFIETEMPHLIIQLTHNARYCLTIIDNGKGIPINSDANQNSLGMILIDAFAKQLDGEISFKNNNGTTFSLTFDEP